MNKRQKRDKKLSLKKTQFASKKVNKGSTSDLYTDTDTDTLVKVNTATSGLVRILTNPLGVLSLSIVVGILYTVLLNWLLVSGSTVLVIGAGVIGGVASFGMDWLKPVLGRITAIGVVGLGVALVLAIISFTTRSYSSNSLTHEVLYVLVESIATGLSLVILVVVLRVPVKIITRLLSRYLKYKNS